MVVSVGKPAQPNSEKPQPFGVENGKDRQAGEGYAECLAHMVGRVDEFSKRAEGNADYFGLDEEMLRAMGGFNCAWTILPDLEKRQPRLGSRGVLVFLQPSIGW